MTSPTGSRRQSLGDDYCDVLDDLLEKMHLDGSEEEQEKSKPPLVVKESFILGENELNELVGGLNEGAKPKVAPKISPLPWFLDRLKQKRKFEDVTRELAVNGRNVLHCIATEPDFAKYKEVVEKIREHKWVVKLLTQIDRETQESPFHVMCLHQNVAMVECLLKSRKVKDMKYHLKISGMKGTKEKCNAFLCLGHSKKAEDGVAMFQLLVNLYEQQPSITMLRDSRDSKERTMVALVKENEKLVIEITSLMVKMSM